MQALQDENEFLRDQVRRLSLELGRQQIGLSSVPEYQGVGALPPWMASPEHVSPLMAAYDRRIAELEATCARLRDDNNRFQPEVGRLVAENERLRGEYRQALLGHGGANTAAELGGSVFVRRVTMEESQELQQRLDLLMAENDVLTDQAREVAAELARLQREKASHMGDAATLRRQLDATREDAREGQLRLDEAERERATLEEQLALASAELAQAQRAARDAVEAAREARAEREAQAAALVEHKRIIQEVSARAHADRDALSAELGRLRGTEGVSSKQLRDIQAELDRANESVQALTAELSSARAELRAFDGALREVEGHKRELELREQAISERFAEARGRLDELQAERDSLREGEGALRAQLAAADGRAREAVAEEARRKEAAVEAVRREAAAQAEHLAEEKRALESACTELRHRLDRARRDRETDRRRDSLAAASGGLGGTAGSLLGRSGSLAALTPAVGGGTSASGAFGTPATSAGVGSAGASGGVPAHLLDELMGRIYKAEQQRDEAASAARADAASARRKAEEAEAERASLRSQVAEAGRHHARLTRELEEARQARLREAARAAELEAEAAAARRDADSARRAHAADAADAQRQQEEAAAAAARRLEAQREAHAKAMQELESLLGAQEALADKYRLEARRAAERAASLVGEVRAENERLTARASELAAQLAALDARRAHAEAVERETSAGGARLGAQLRAAEARAADASGQVRAAAVRLGSERHAAAAASRPTSIPPLSTPLHGSRARRAPDPARGRGCVPCPARCLLACPFVFSLNPPLPVRSSTDAPRSRPCAHIARRRPPACRRLRSPARAPRWPLPSKRLPARALTWHTPGSSCATCGRSLRARSATPQACPARARAVPGEDGAVLRGTRLHGRAGVRG